MLHKDVDYLFLYPYKYDYYFNYMVKKVLNSFISKIIKKDNEVFKEKMIYSLTKDPSGFRYIESVGNNKKYQC